MSRPTAFSLVAIPLLSWTASAVGADFMSAEDAQHLMFPAATSFEPLLVPLSTASGLGISASSLSTTRFFVAKQDDQVLGTFVLDAVIGKFQLINYAVAFDPKGAVKDIEVLAYREAHGAEVRNAAWRQQFVGKTAAAPLLVGEDIDNISGATLSCTHLTDGVRKLARLVQASAHA
jgi:Na+-translocating ferredoxin:NAD+ oxidoreductase RnfG subunit